MVTADADYRFEVGAGSYNLGSGLKLLKVAPTIYSLTEVH